MSPRRAGGNDASSACKDAAAGRSRRRAWRLERAAACVEAALARTRPETQIATFTQARGDAFGPRPCAPRASRAGSRPPAEKNRSESGRTSLGRGHGTDSARDARLAGRARAPERRRRERHRLGSSEGRHGACSRRVRWEVCGGLDAISKRPFTTQQTKRLRSTRKSTGARRSCAAQDFHAGRGELANAFETSYGFRRYSSLG